MITEIEKTYFDNLFYRGGYVLDGNHALRRPVARANKTTRAHERSHCRAPLINSFKIEHTSIELNCRQ